MRYVTEDDNYLIISGERRYQAALQAGLTEIPCWVQTPQGQDILLRQITENWQRRDLEPLELANALALLRDSYHYTQSAMAALLSKPESEISRLLSLLKLQPEIQQAARSTPAGTFTKRHLSAIAQLPAEDQQEIMVAVQGQKLTALDTERLVKDAKTRGDGVRTRGAPYGQRLRYMTDKATVVLTFRRRNVTAEEILAALDDVRRQVQKGTIEQEQTT